MLNVSRSDIEEISDHEQGEPTEASEQQGLLENTQEKEATSGKKEPEGQSSKDTENFASFLKGSLSRKLLNDRSH